MKVTIAFSDWEIIRAGHLWYLWSLFVAYLIILLMNKLLTSHTYIYNVMLPLLFVLHLLVYIVTQTFELLWHWRANVFVSSLPWMLMGSYLASNACFLKSITDKTVLILSGVGAVIAVIFEISDFAIDLSEVGIIIYAVCLFAFSLRHLEESRCKMLEKIGEKYSLDVYIFHIAVLAVVTKVYSALGLGNNSYILMLNPLIVVVLTLLWSVF